MFPSWSSVPALALLYSTGSGCRPFPNFTVHMGHPTPLPHQRDSGLPLPRLTSGVDARFYTGSIGIHCTCCRRSFFRVAPFPFSPRGRSRASQGYWAVLFDRATVDHPAGSPLAIRLNASRATAFQAREPLSTGTRGISGLIHCGPAARLPTHQPPCYQDSCKTNYRPAGYALTGRGLHPQDN